ncbi:VOC family protein [Marivita sp.]|jgi:glyoxylase I family protein|uniref:VOC family protein n=1 Tax=Marivita sp. TaxID=2003365 RepID=UPI003F6BCBEC
MGPFRGLHHVAVICSDYQRSRAFYTETLGLTVNGRVKVSQRAAQNVATLGLG